MEWTILDHLRNATYKYTVSNAPYEIDTVDLEEIKAGTYLANKASVLRIVKEIVAANDLSVITRKREIVDQRRYLYHVLTTRAGLTVSASARLFSKDHATVLHALRDYDIIAKNLEYKETITDLYEFFNNPKYVNYV